MNRRNFFQRVASGLFVAAAPTLFLPKLIKPQWKALPDPACVWPTANRELALAIERTCGIEAERMMAFLEFSGRSLFFADQIIDPVNQSIAQPNLDGLTPVENLSLHKL